MALGSCTSKSASISQEKPKEEEHEHEHEEGPQTSTELTEEQMQAVGITLGSFEMKNLANSEKINGILRVPSSDKAVVTALFGGVVTSVKIHEGDYVKKGQVIAAVTNPEYIDVQEQYLLVKNQIAYAEQEFERQQELFEHGAGAKKNLQSAATQLKDLHTQKASLTKRLQLMGINTNTISNANIHDGLAIVAPINGTVSIITAQIGSYVNVSSPLAEIIDNAAIHLDLQVFEKDIPTIRLGQGIDFTLTNIPSRGYKAKVYKIGSSFENDSKTISVHCIVEGDKQGLIDGMSAVGVLNLGTALTMAVPSEAIVEIEGKSYLFVQTDKVEQHNHKEGDSHDAQERADHGGSKTINFERREVAKGVSDLGYTAFVPVEKLEKDAVIVVKGAFFVNAKMNNTGEHEH